MTRLSTGFVSLTLVAALTAGLPGASREEIITQPLAAIYGLTRAWLTQVDMDSSQSRLQEITLFKGCLYVRTSFGVLQAFDAETGQPLWDSAKQVGQTTQPSRGPGVCDRYLAVTNGTRLYVLNRATGSVLWERQLDNPPVAGPTLTDHRVFVPLANDMIASYRLRTTTGQVLPSGKVVEGSEVVTPAEIRLEPDLATGPLTCHSMGRVSVPLLLVKESDEEDLVAWPTEQGYLTVGRVDHSGIAESLTVAFRLETGAPLTTRPTYVPPDPTVEDDVGMIYAGSHDGFVHAVNEKGQPRWRFPTGDDLVEPLAATDSSVFVCQQLGGMYCLDAKTGQQRWWSPHITRFVAAGKNLVYGSDSHGRLYILNSANGQSLGTMDLPTLSVRMMNMRTDRLYLATPRGLVQCLHEKDVTEPLVYRLDKQVAIKTPAKPKKAAEEKSEAKAPGEAAAEPPAPQPAKEEEAKEGEKKEGEAAPEAPAAPAEKTE